MHSTFRCESCNKIEKMTKSVLDKNFDKELKNGKIRWATVDFQQNQKLAEKFKVVASCVVVESVASNGKSKFERLDKVWTLLDKKTEFISYIKTAVQKMLDVGLKGKFQ